MKKFHISLLVLLNLLVGALSTCSSEYGSEPCSFIPAPPGKTPGCARPGFTYCEHPDHYPGQLIHHLIQKWRFDHSSILSDESKEEYGAYYYPAPSPGYGPPTHFPEPIHIPKPQFPFNPSYSDFKLKPAVNFTSNFNYNMGQSLPYRYNTDIPQSRSNYFPRNYFTSIGEPQYNYDNALWKRHIEVKYQKLKRSLRYKRAIIETTLPNNSTLSRFKRQNTLIGESLCTTRSQYIMPKAALNNKGNWMYIVNMPEVDKRFSQLVKSELCASQTCSGLCGLPVGYASRCEQKYVQKRLVALEGGGNQLYTDVFWFPSCCVCTISNN